MSQTAEATRTRLRPLDALVLVASLSTLVSYAVHAAALVRYPWDWSPDEGLFLDHARRILEAPRTLYGRSAVPFPACHGPLLPLLLAPIVALFPEPLHAARILAAGWTTVIVAGVFLLVRKRADWPLALASAALALAPFNLTFWYMLVRVDGLMTALWLLAALALLPQRLERGSDRLSWPRIAAGSLLLLASVLAKASAVAYGAPLVLGWLLVDRASAARLCLTLGAGGLAVFLGLQALTDGGFLWAMRLWALMPIDIVFMKTNLWIFFERAWTVLLLAVVGLLVAVRAGARPWRAGATLLWLGGLLIVPAMSMLGAWWNYLLPLLCATVVLGGWFWAVPARPGSRPLQSLGAVCVALLALWLAASRRFPLPTEEVEATAGAFYAFVSETARSLRRPILAARPEYAYFVAGQASEVEGSTFTLLVRAKAQGMERVRERLEAQAYGLVLFSSFPPAFSESLERRYVRVGTCEREFFYGPTVFTFLVPRDSQVRFDPPPGTRCRPLPRLASAGTDSAARR